MFEGFTDTSVDIEYMNIRVRYAGDGPPILLLHGNPQTSAMWRHVAPKLAETHTVFCPDLRGYGFTDKPPSGEGSENYTKRRMAQDMILMMEEFHFTKFDVCGHDRGGRVAHRMAHDHPNCVRRLAVLDIAPTREMYANTTMAFARDYWHWFFMIQPHPMPEDMMGADPDRFWLAKCTKQGGSHEIFGEGLAEYLKAFRNPETIRATCDDYRAAATIDIAHDNAEVAKMTVPLLCLWGSKGAIEKHFDPLELWRARAENVRGWSLPCAHYMAEEMPDEVTAALLEFFDGPL